MRPSHGVLLGKRLENYQIERALQEIRLFEFIVGPYRVTIRVRLPSRRLSIEK
jgi:hypothetical protein